MKTEETPDYPSRPESFLHSLEDKLALGIGPFDPTSQVGPQINIASVKASRRWRELEKRGESSLVTPLCFALTVCGHVSELNSYDSARRGHLRKAAQNRDEWKELAFPLIREVYDRASKYHPSPPAFSYVEPFARAALEYNMSTGDVVETSYDGIKHFDLSQLGEFAVTDDDEESKVITYSYQIGDDGILRYLGSSDDSPPPSKKRRGKATRETDSAADQTPKSPVGRRNPDRKAKTRFGSRYPSG